MNNLESYICFSQFKTVTSDGTQVFYNRSQQVTRPTHLWSKDRNKWSVKWLPALQSIACSLLYEACKTDIFAYGEPVLFINGKSHLIVYTSGQKHHYKNITMARKTGECLNICNSVLFCSALCLKHLLNTHLLFTL